MDRAGGANWTTSVSDMDKMTLQVVGAPKGDRHKVLGGGLYKQLVRNRAISKAEIAEEDLP